MRVLVTGAAGGTGISIIQALSQAKRDIIGFDLKGVRYRDDVGSLLNQMIAGDVSDFNQIQEAIQSAAVYAIIHLAIAIEKDDYQKPDIPFAVNVKGTYNLFEAAREKAINKIILISSAAVYLPQKLTHHPKAVIDWRSSPNDDHLYDLTKCLQEEIAKDFCETFGMKAVVLRAGHIVDGKKRVDSKGRDLAGLEYCRGGWVCRYDVAQACLKALEVNPTGYVAFHLIGADQARQSYDIDRTERELGFRFETRFEHDK